MPEIHELFDSRASTESADNPSVELKYAVLGTDEDLEVNLLVEATIPAFFGGRVFQDYTKEALGGGVWNVSVHYGKLAQKETGDSTFSFDTSGGSVHITQALEEVAVYVPSGATAPNFKGAIGVTPDSVAGTDITVPVYAFSETHYLDDALVTPAYKATLFALTGRTNNATFKGFQAGEVLFLGARGSKRGEEDWEVYFGFAASQNVTGLTVGDITGIAKKGWEYLWVRYEDSEDTAAKTLIKKPVAVVIDRVYESGNMAGLGIGV